MALSTDDAARLALLKAAYDKLITGAQTASVGSGDRRVDFARGDIASVKAEIETLTAAAASPVGRTRGAINFRIR